MTPEIEYIGEWVFPSRLGHALVIFSMVSAALAGFSFWSGRRESSEDSPTWTRIGTAAWILHSFSLLSLIGLIFFLMANRRYEFSYVFAHVNDQLSMRYILSAFWEGQEGSFLLWMFWHVVLGSIILRRRKVLYRPVMGIFCLVQVILLTMIAGIYIPVPFSEAFAKIGSSPFTLLRETMDIPLFLQADYVDQLQGQGLNALLQNYWMTIHPPTLFLGFAATLPPFAYAVSALAMGEHKSWLRQGIRWSLFGAGILGIGILMGAAWAYEALSFGGYWAWDPVENTSLVPWLLLVAGIHVNLAAKNTGHGLKAAYFFYILTFGSTLYSTFLTRSGILGDSSAHAFTEMGLEWQLVIFMVVMLGLALGWYAYRYNSIPQPEREERIDSKEFWLFVAGLVLLMSTILITFTTSIPVYNKIGEYLGLDWQFSEPTDREAHHNRFQIWIAVLIGLLSGVAQYLRFREKNWQSYKSRFWTKVLLSLGISAALFLGLNFLIFKFTYWVHCLALFAGLYTVVSNVDIMIASSGVRNRIASSALSHIGFGLFLVGVLVTGINKYHISTNEFAQKGLMEEGKEKENILLFENLPMYMSGYWVTYTGDTLVNNKRTFDIELEERDENGNPTKSFDIHPYILYTNDMASLASTNPYTRRYWNRDIFSTVSSLPESMHGRDAAREVEEAMNYEMVSLKNGDTLRQGDFLVTLEEIEYNPQLDDKIVLEEGDMTMAARLRVLDSLGNPIGTVRPGILRMGEFVYDYPDQLQKERIRIKLTQEVLRDAMPSEFELAYDTITLQRGIPAEWQDFKISIEELISDSLDLGMELKAEDLAVQARLKLMAQGEEILLSPTFVLRGGRVLSPSTWNLAHALTGRFLAIDPGSNTLSFALARIPALDELKLMIATEVPRTDLIVLETIVFPGINLIWLGGLLMMVGMLIGAWKKDTNIPSQIPAS